MWKPHDSRAIANIFIEKAQQTGQRLSIMPLVKYVYLAHGWTLGYTQKPLISDDVEAWKFGPVVPAVYWEFRSQGLAISEKAKDKKGNPYTVEWNTDEDKEIVSNVYDAYSVLEPWNLSNLTHGSDSPWYKYRNSYWCKIPTNEIQKYYEGTVAKVKEKHGKTSN